MSYRDPMDFKAKCLQYFFAFSAKDLNIGNMFADNVGLRDWENSAEGKVETLAVYEKIFNSVDNISVTPFAMYQDNNTVVCELLITINGDERIFVLDIIGFDPDTGLIDDIRAYRGN